MIVSGSYLDMLLPEENNANEDDGQDCLNEKPCNDLRSVRLAEKFFSVLDAENTLAEHNCAINPALSSHSFACRVSCVNIILP